MHVKLQEQWMLRCVTHQADGTQPPTCSTGDMLLELLQPHCRWGLECMWQRGVVQQGLHLHATGQLAGSIPHCKQPAAAAATHHRNRHPLLAEAGDVHVVCSQQTRHQLKHQTTLPSTSKCNMIQWSDAHR